MKDILIDKMREYVFQKLINYDKNRIKTHNVVRLLARD